MRLRTLLFSLIIYAAWAASPIGPCPVDSFHPAGVALSAGAAWTTDVAWAAQTSTAEKSPAPDSKNATSAGTTQKGAPSEPKWTPANPAKLAAAIAQADKIVVFEGSNRGAPVLFTSTSPDDIAAFGEALTIIVSDQQFYCACLGTPVVRLFSGKTELAEVTNHHGVSVRCSLWDGNAGLRDPEKWVRWFSERGMPKPGQALERSKTEQEKSRESYKRWLAAVPASLRPLWPDTGPSYDEADKDALYAALCREFPDDRLRVLVLFGLFGSGRGPWSGYPAYDSRAEELLLRLPTSILIAAAESPDLSEAQLEGAARLFAGYDFWKLRPRDAAKLPKALKQKLLAQALKSAHPDNIERAQSAFGKK